MVLEPDRSRGILSKSDREFLLTLGDDMKEQSVRNARQRIRDRIRNALLDFTFLLERPQHKDFQTISDDVSRENDLYRSLAHTVAFAYRIAEYADIDPEEITEQAIRINEPFATEVTIQIDYKVEQPIRPDAVVRQIRNGERPSPRAVGVAVASGALEWKDIERLHDLVDPSDWGPGIIRVAGPNHVDEQRNKDEHTD